MVVHVKEDGYAQMRKAAKELNDLLNSYKITHERVLPEDDVLVNANLELHMKDNYEILEQISGISMVKDHND